MTRYVIGRVVQGIVALLLASIIVFFLARLTGNPVSIMLPDNASPEAYAAMTKYLGLDKPIIEQYFIFITNAIRGDFGDSLRYRAPVIDFILSAAPATIKLASAAMIVGIIIAVPAGILAAVKRDKIADTLAKAFAVLGQSMPNFWLAILLIQIFAVQLNIFPAGGSGGIEFWILPAIALGWHSCSGILRLTRSAMLDVLTTDYVRLARIKGVPDRLVIWKHALRNALIPVVTFSSVLYVQLLMGSVVCEAIFAWPGIGRLAYQAVMNRDFPMIQALIMIFVGLFVLANLLTDILYCYLDPRIRFVKE